MAPCSKTTTCTFGSNSPPHPGKVKFPTPRDGLSDQIPDSPGKVNIQMPGVCPEGGC